MNSRFGNSRTKKSHQRTERNKPPFERTLIVCEGVKTEPYYLRGLINELRLNTASIEVTNCPDGTSPINIVKYASKQKKNDKGIDVIFCVFDGDCPQHFSSAINHARRHKLTTTITSPCFEWWLLLHFVRSTSAYSVVPGCSTCDRVVDELKRPGHLPNYVKGYMYFLKLSTCWQLPSPMPAQSHWKIRKPALPIQPPTFMN